LLLTATIWGSAFVAQSMGMDHVKQFTFTCIRSMIGGIVLSPCVFFICFKEKRKKLITKVEWIGGICCGIALFAASNFQQYGVVYTTAGKAGFITALYVVLVPIFGIFFRRKVSLRVLGCVALAVVGLYLLCIPNEAFHVNRGDLLVSVCAILFTIHILVIDYFAPQGNGVIMSCIQFLVCGVLSAGVMALTEHPSTHAIWEAKWSILYAGVLSSGVAYTLQIVGQKDMNPTVAALILCLESVVAVITDWIVLDERLNTREKIGCVLMFMAIVVAQIPKKERK